MTAPNEPSMIIKPLMRAKRSLGNQRTIILRPDISAAALPSPIIARAMRSETKPVDSPKSAAPAAATTKSKLWTRRGP